jgi:O-antigen/teichoic acid export membrane protein
LEFDKKFWAVNLKESWPYGLSGFSVMLYTYIDSVILSLIQGNEVVGWYNAAYKLVLFLVFIPSTINLTIFPAMSKFYISSPNSLRFINEEYFKFMLIIGIPLGIGTTILADRIILIIFGSGYSSSIIALQILIWTIVFTFAGAAFVRLLEATNKQLLLSKITGISVVVNVILNLILIPKFSYVGASIATLLTEIILILMIFRITNKLGFGIKTIKIGHYLIKTIFASIVMGIFIFYFKNYNLVLLILLSSLIYLSTLFVVRGIDQEDILLFKRILNKD